MIRAHSTRRLADPARLREKAQSLQKSIDAKRDPAIGRLNPTRRRMSIAASMWHDAQRLQEIQEALRAMADAIDAQQLPECLAGVTSKSQLERILFYHRDEDAAARQWLEARRRGLSEEDLRRQRIAELERDLVGRDIPGFFPTPPALVDRLLSMAEICPEHSVLEPSAGKGDLAEALRSCNPEQLEVVEINHTLCELLVAKGFAPHRADFLELNGAGFHRVVMNPPFESGQDIEHTRHAYDCLAPGGRLVGIMSAGPFYRRDRRAEAFREWFDQVGGRSEEIVDGFAGRDAFRRTGVRTRLVVLDKPGV